MDKKQLIAIIEGALFARSKPMTVDNLLALFQEEERPEKAELLERLDEITELYQERGVELRHLASGYTFMVRQELSPWIAPLFTEKPPKYGRALLETLAIIAYRQPVTRADIEEIRGVAVSSLLIKTLLEREWIRFIGHRDLPGKPSLYATTKSFLDYFGLKNLNELPPLSELKNLDELELEPELLANLQASVLETAEEEIEETEEEIFEEL